MTYYAPALQFEQETGLSGLSRRYEMPGKISSWYLDEEMQYHCRQPEILCFALEGYADNPYAKFQRAQLGPEGKLRALSIFTPYSQELLDLNPELKTIEINPDLVIDHYHLILGATSRFNIPDIQYFINRSHGNISPETDHACKVRKDQIGEQISATLGRSIVMQWTPSDKTLDLVEKQWREKYPQISLSGRAFPSPAGP